MGKQLYFYHTEEDVIQFLSYLDKCYGKFVVNSMLYDPSEMVDTIVAEMSISCSQYTVAYVPDNSFVKQSRYVCIGEGTAIEFTNCRRWKKTSCAYLDIGRIYLRSSNGGSYDENALALYKKLHYYFRKEYNYNKALGVYLSYSVQRQCDAQEILLSQMGHPLSF